ncbi:hypothetical protein ACFL54_05780 [Planctomycetota bacterium]
MKSLKDLKENEFGRLLSECQTVVPSEDLLRKLEQEPVDDTSVSATTGLSRKWISIAVALAAVMLVVILAHSFIKEEPQVWVNEVASVMIRPQLPEGIPHFRVYEVLAKADYYQAMLQDMKKIQLQIVHTGDRIGPYQVLEVTELGIVLADDKGAHINLNSDSNKDKWDKFLADLEEYYKSQVENRVLGNNEFEEMSRLAMQGHEGALGLIQMMARDEGSHYHEKARLTLVGNQGKDNRHLSHVQQLISTAKSGRQKYRIRALKQLGSLHSPLVAKSLRAGLTDPNDPLLGLIIELVKENRDMLAIKDLKKLAASARCPEALRQAAGDAILEIIGDAE